VHYIVGTEFVKSGKELTLYHISRKGDKINYTFTESTGNKFDLLFDSTQQADKYIAGARNEQLPDYGKFYDASN
tara:strand:- start:189 stop:410 length:222 start_codon:yes stop_codon:yes gene_type:complete